MLLVVKLLALFPCLVMLDFMQVWFEGGYSDYEADYKQRTGALDPSRVKYRRMAATTYA